MFVTDIYCIVCQEPWGHAPTPLFAAPGGHNGKCPFTFKGPERIANKINVVGINTLIADNFCLLQILMKKIYYTIYFLSMGSTSIQFHLFTLSMFLFSPFLSCQLLKLITLNYGNNSCTFPDSFGREHNELKKGEVLTINRLLIIGY